MSLLFTFGGFLSCVLIPTSSFLPLNPRLMKLSYSLKHPNKLWQNDNVYDKWYRVYNIVFLHFYYIWNVTLFWYLRWYTILRHTTKFFVPCFVWTDTFLHRWDKSISIAEIGLSRRICADSSRCVPRVTGPCCTCSEREGYWGCSENIYSPQID